MAVLAVGGSPDESNQPPGQGPIPTVARCTRLHKQSDYKRLASKVYLGQPQIAKKTKRRLKVLLTCQHSSEAIKNLRRWRRHIWKQRKAWLELLRLTPYDCGANGRFAIPCYIVACESHFNWTARNPSGAWGAYQLLGWLPYGSSRLAQHRMAAKLWAGGAGASHWVCA